VPLDIVLSVDLSNSMDSAGSSVGHSRIVWAKIAAIRFLDSLKTGDRVALQGWTASRSGAVMSDTAIPSRYYQKWSGFISDFNAARAFIRDSLFLDGTSRSTDTCQGLTLAVRDVIPLADFGYTPMHIAGIVAVSRLSALGRPAAKKAVIMLSDGVNNDAVPRATATASIDSLRRLKSLQFNTIGFMQGDTAELHSLAIAGSGNFYNAVNPGELDSAYIKLAGLLVEKKIDTTFATTPIRVTPDTLRAPVDVILAIDLSGSMETIEINSLTRLALAKTAALGFLDSLKPQDRVSVLGWTSSSGSADIFLSDTINPNRYCQKWCNFTSNFKAAGRFITDSLYPNDAQFGYTPLRVSSILAMKHLSSYTRPEANKVVIMLTDGENNDGETRNAVVSFLDSLRRTQGLQFHTIGFKDGDTVELRALANAGGGVFYNAKDNNELQNAYASLAHQIVREKLAARKLMIQEVINHPPLDLVSGSQKSTTSSTVPLQSCESLQDAAGNTVLRWYFSNIPVWGTAEVSYTVVATSGKNTVIGVDSAHATGGFWSQFVYTDDALAVHAINILPTGSGPTVSIAVSKPGASVAAVSFRDNAVVCMYAPGVRSKVSLTLFAMNGRIAHSAEALNCAGQNSVVFRIPKTTAAGVYAVRVRWENAIQWKMVRLIR
jgi:Mg-chelatase subunit ChlD